MPGNYEYKYMQKVDIEDVKKFISSNFKNESYHNRTGWFEWQYVNNPDGCHVLLCLKNKRIIAISGFIPCQLLVGSRIYTGSFATNTMVDHTNRRQGIGRKIHLERVKNFDFALSSGQSDSNYKLYMKMKWNILGCYYNIVLRKEFPFFPSFKKDYLKEFYSWIVWSLGTLFKRKPNFRLEETMEIPSGIDSFFNDRFDKNSIGALRSRKFLMWRYQEHPYFKYQFIKVFRNNNFIGFAVMRDTIACKILIDMYCQYKDMEDLLLGIGIKLKTRLIIGRFTGLSLKKKFDKSNWLSFKSKSHLIAKSSDPSLERLAMEMDWNFLGGDSDKDR